MEFDGADIKPSVVNFLIVGIMALVFLFAGKSLFGRFNVPGLSELFANV